MAAYVDAKNCVVRDGDAALPFDIDCHDGIARIALGNQRYALRPLSWREKRNLARFSHLGEQFLQTQFLRVSLNKPAVELPASEEQRAVLSALARWINAPDGDFGLPLDQRLLASVTVDICRSMQLAPAMFDAMNATEVEMLWRVTRTGQPESTQVATAASAAVEPGMARIVVLPDGADATVFAAPNKHTESNNVLREEGKAVPAEMAGVGTGVRSIAANTNAISQPDAVRLDVAERTAAAAILSKGNVFYTRLSNTVKNQQSPARVSQLTDIRNRFRVDFSAPDFIAASAKSVVNQNSVIAPHSVQRDASLANRAALNTQIFASTQSIGNMQNVASHGDLRQPHSVSGDAMILFPAFFAPAASALAFAENPRTATAQLNAAMLETELPKIIATVAIPTAEFSVTAMPQIADRLFDIFAERLGEAACAAGIDLEY